MAFCAHLGLMMSREIIETSVSEETHTLRGRDPATRAYACQAMAWSESRPVARSVHIIFPLLMEGIEVHAGRTPTFKFQEETRGSLLPAGTIRDHSKVAIFGNHC